MLEKNQFLNLKRSFPPSKTAEISMAVLLPSDDQTFLPQLLKWRISKKALRKVGFALRNIVALNFDFKRFLILIKKSNLDFGFGCFYL